MNILRDENGIMLMKVLPSMCNELLNNLEGSVVIKKFKDGRRVSCFVLNKDQSISNHYIGVIYLWEGSYIELGEV